ncbi:uncharacterized protein [Choristoneura fumiferana]|uniref:uncharacterized protein n=1 Tax=Choristoneura fumiferana TaxID=7141 RepID=UPI003D15EC3C
MFNKHGNRLKRNPYPTLKLNTPLSDEILANFPICNHKQEKEKDISLDCNPSTSKTPDCTTDHGNNPQAIEQAHTYKKRKIDTSLDCNPSTSKSKQATMEGAISYRYEYSQLKLTRKKKILKKLQRTQILLKSLSKTSVDLHSLDSDIL